MINADYRSWGRAMVACQQMQVLPGRGAGQRACAVQGGRAVNAEAEHTRHPLPSCPRWWCALVVARFGMTEVNQAWRLRASATALARWAQKFLYVYDDRPLRENAHRNHVHLQKSFSRTIKEPHGHDFSHCSFLSFHFAYH